MNIFNKIEENKLYNNIMILPISYKTGAILLVLLSLAHLVVFETMWVVSGAYTVWGGKLFLLFGIDVSKWNFFIVNSGLKRSLFVPIIRNGTALRNIGIVLGALLSSLFASEFKIVKLRNKKQIIGGIVGGLLMGIGSRIASGCNVGAFFSSILSFSLTGWIFGIVTFIGAIIGSKILLKYLL